MCKRAMNTSEPKATNFESGVFQVEERGGGGKRRLGPLSCVPAESDGTSECVLQIILLDPPSVCAAPLAVVCVAVGMLGFR